MSNTNRLICTVGLPRSGKTTWARTHRLPIVSPDAIRLALHGHRFIAEAEPHVWAIAKTMVRALFLAGHEAVILDATNTTRKRRAEWLSPQWETLFKVFDTPVGTCVARAGDDAEMVSVIRRMNDQFEPLLDEALLYG